MKLGWPVKLLVVAILTPAGYFFIRYYNELPSTTKSTTIGLPSILFAFHIVFTAWLIYWVIRKLRFDISRGGLIGSYLGGYGSYPFALILGVSLGGVGGGTVGDLIWGEYGMAIGEGAGVFTVTIVICSCGVFLGCMLGTLAQKLAKTVLLFKSRYLSRRDLREPGVDQSRPSSDSMSVMSSVRLPAPIMESRLSVNLSVAAVLAIGSYFFVRMVHDHYHVIPESVKHVLVKLLFRLPLVLAVVFSAYYVHWIIRRLSFIASRGDLICSYLGGYGSYPFALFFGIVLGGFLTLWIIEYVSDGIWGRIAAGYIGAGVCFFIVTVSICSAGVFFGCWLGRLVRRLVDIIGTAWSRAARARRVWSRSTPTTPKA